MFRRRFRTWLREVGEDCFHFHATGVTGRPEAGGTQQTEFGMRVKVNCSSWGDSGDSFTGTISVRIRKGRWINFQFSQ